MEEWRDIPGYPGYQASDLGRVRSVDRPVKYRASARAAGYTVMRKGRILRPAPANNPGNPSGHLMVMAGRGRNLLVHTAVALAFHGPRPRHAEVRHLDGDETNNRSTNLVWGTHSQNGRDIVHHGGRKLSVEQVHAIREMLRKGESLRKLGRLFGVNSGTICHIRDGRQYAHV